MIVCFFDIDGTLLHTGGAGMGAMQAALAAEFDTTLQIEGIPTAGRTDRAIVSDCFAYFQAAEDEVRWERFLKTYVGLLPKFLQEREGTVLPGVLEVLQELSQRDDLLLGLLTGNFREGARLKLQHYAIYDYFLFGGYGDRYHERDDVAREALADAVRHHGTEFRSNRVWVIGDTPADVQCARAIGANAVAVATGTYSHQELHATRPDHLFEDFSDPSRLLRLF